MERSPQYFSIFILLEWLRPWPALVYLPEAGGIQAPVAGARKGAVQQAGGLWMAVNVKEARGSQSRAAEKLRRRWYSGQRSMENSLEGCRDPETNWGSGVELLCLEKELGKQSKTGALKKKRFFSRL